MTNIISRLLDEAEKAQRKGHLVLADVCREASDRIGLLEHEVERVQHERNLAQSERDRLAAEYAKAQLAILPWIEQVGALNAAYDIHTHALRRIGMPGVDVDCSKEGHMIAVLVARDALKEGGK